jgi:hypothetical protein
MGDIKMAKFYGFEMTEEQAEQLSDVLTEDILQRYNTPEYINWDIVEEFAQEHNLQRID